MTPYERYAKFELPQLTENDYGIQWPTGTAQITKEFLCLKHIRMRQKGKGMMSGFMHFLNIQRLLFPGIIDLYKDVKKGRIWNNYYLDIARKLCEFKNTTLTGPASANKTFCAASFDLTMFLSAPSETLVMVSTTSGGASERRIWADIKTMHGEAKYDQCGIEPIGEVIDYLKAIVYDEGKQLGGATKNSRDFRNGISVIPIAVDQTGASALATIMGSKNRFVYWTLDEMPAMNEGVTRPNGNLRMNPFYQFIGIGNATDVNDPHGKDCMPLGGLDALTMETDREWTAANGRSVLFLPGFESPNSHPFIDQSKITQPNDYPYPYASNEFNSNENAVEYGNGDPIAGRETVDYYKFSIGFWPPPTATRALYTPALFKMYGATKPVETIMQGKRKFAGGDFAFTTGGDSNSLYTLTFGYNAQQQKIINCSKETKIIRSKATSSDEFNRQIAKGYVQELIAEQVAWRDFGADTGADAALTLNEMGRIAKTHDFVGISSIGAAANTDKYDNKVTELWFKVRDLVRTGLMRGIAIEARFVQQLCKRRYESLSKSKKQIEPKRTMKKRIGRSPDDADAFIYACWMLIKSGLVDEELSSVKEIQTDEEETEVIREMRNPTRVIKEEDQDYSQLTESFEEYDEVF